jgi:DNA-binding NtrC family response regulator
VESEYGDAATGTPTPKTPTFVDPTRLTGTNPPVRILVVDDEENICEVLARTLVGFGYVVDVALDAEAALVTMMERPASVALVDIRMPGRDGAWLIERLQKSHPRTTIVIITGIIDLDPRLTLRPGVVGYLTKPFESAQVRDVVAKAVVEGRKAPPPATRRSLAAGTAEDDLPDLQDFEDPKR